MTTLYLRKSISRPLRWLGFVLVPMVLACFAVALAPNAFGVVPAPDGGYPGGNTAEGTDALFNLTTGGSNTAIGEAALFSNTTGNFNTANGVSALFTKNTRIKKTAKGLEAPYTHNNGN